MNKTQFVFAENEYVFARWVSADCWKMPQVIGNRQVSGKISFTNQRIIFLASGLIGTQKLSWEISMREISAVKPCLTPPFFPFGIEITLKSGDLYRLGMLNRKKYINWISQNLPLL